MTCLGFETSPITIFILEKEAFWNCRLFAKVCFAVNSSLKRSLKTVFLCVRPKTIRSSVCSMPS